MFGARPLPRTFEAALRDITADKPAVRAASVRDLVAHVAGAEADRGGADPRDRAVRALQRALRHDEAAQVRAVAATALADVGASEALPELLLAVEDDHPLVRQMAISALGELGDARATERLRRALADSRAEVRFQAVMAFPRVSASREAARDALLHATHDEDALVCHIALRMMDEVGAGAAPDPRLIARARALVGHASPEVRVASAILLASLPPELRAEAGAGGAEGKCREILVDVARGALRTSDREDEAAAVELSGEIGLEAARPGLEKRAFGGLLGLRRDPLAWHARVALARTGHERACREILGELGARDRDVCTLAVAAAGRARLAAARPRLLALRGNAGRADPHAVDEALAELDGLQPPTGSPSTASPS